MSSNPEDVHYSIAAVSKLTGVSCHTLRVWERRYGFPRPRRSGSGHRRYGADQVGILRRIAARIRSGHSIGDVIAEWRAGRLEPGLDLGGAPEHGVASSPTAEAPAVAPHTELVESLGRGDLVAAQGLYDALAGRMSVPELLDRVIEPAFVECGEGWFQGRFHVFQERSISGFLRRRLEELYEAAQRANRHPRATAVIGTVQGERHEGGTLMLAVMLERSGWRALLMGVDLPVEEYARAVARWRPDALGLSFVMSRNITKRFQELSGLRDVPIFVGGRSILNYQGLARRHGLIPLAGSITSTVEEWSDRVSEWQARTGRAPT